MDFSSDSNRKGNMPCQHFMIVRIVWFWRVQKHDGKLCLESSIQASLVVGAFDPGLHPFLSG